MTPRKKTYFLALDTSTPHLSFAIAEGERVLWSERRLLERKHATDLLPILESVFERLGFSVREIGVFIVGTGPGSFTGLRVGISTVKAMASALKKTVVAVPTCDCLAETFFRQSRFLPEEAVIVPFIDAKRRQVYAALYERQDGELRKKVGEKVIAPDVFLKTLKGEVFFLGDGAVLYREAIRERLGERARIADPAFSVPDPAVLLALGVQRFEKGCVADPKTLVPLYLHPKNCMISR